jgi:hypothetical protein
VKAHAAIRPVALAVAALVTLSAPLQAAGFKSAYEAGDIGARDRFLARCAAVNLYVRDYTKRHSPGRQGRIDGADQNARALEDLLVRYHMAALGRDRRAAISFARALIGEMRDGYESVHPVSARSLKTPWTKNGPIGDDIHVCGEFFRVRR